jgi:hypothetical protein
MTILYAVHEFYSSKRVEGLFSGVRIAPVLCSGFPSYGKEIWPPGIITCRAPASIILMLL